MSGNRMVSRFQLEDLKKWAGTTVMSIQPTSPNNQKKQITVVKKNYSKLN